MQTPRIFIIGGGLSGLLIAYLLQQKGVTARVLEARGRPGGRIETLRTDDGSHIEMGAAWLGKKHRHLLDLLRELDIGITEQYIGEKGFYEPMSVSPPQLVDLPAADEPSYRIAGGTDSLIRALYDRLGQDQVHMNTPVKSIHETETGLKIDTDQDPFEADLVISTLPPALLVSHVHFSPALPDELTGVALQTHTWMADSIKVALAYENPFWRNPGSGGTIFSNVGPVNEMYDHSGDDHFALKGFMNGAYHAVSRELRQELVTEQLRRYYGGKADNILSYHDCVWRNEPFTYCAYKQPVVPHQNNGNPLFHQSYLSGRLLLAGAETATAFPGYMDGAVESAYRAVQQIHL